tara:strand:+ start:741 stop:989 length:249 start_codon:yes stop_codon:yes gene_type:complete
MATIELQRKGADLLYIRNGVQSTTRINLFEIEIDVKPANNTMVFLNNGSIIDFNVDSVVGLADAEAVGDQIGAWLKQANTGV